MSNVWAANIVAAACAARISSCTDHHLQRALKATHLSVSLKMKSIQHTICKPNPPGINHRSIHLDGVEVVDHRMRWTAAFITAVCFHLGSAQASDIVNISSASEDQLLSIVRTIETRLDSTITSLRTILPSSAETAATAQQRQAAISLINEVYEVVDRNFDDSRNSAFSSKQWSSLHNDILQRPLRSMEETRSAVREMLSRLNDPYSRFLPPEEFSAMSKYDVSGVGVNLGTLDELQSKTGLSPLYLSPLYSTSSGSNNNTTNDTNDSPSSRNMEENKIRDSNSIDTNHQQRGVWVVGILRGSLAEQAGIKQGDQLVMADGAPLGNKSPFEVASLLQGSDFVDKLTGVPNSKPIQVVIRHVDGNQETIELNRPEKVRTPSPVTYKLEENGTVGYVKLSSFNARAQKDVSKAIKDLKSRGAERFVLDLRGNRGGLVSEGIEVARLFLSDNEVIVQTRGKARSSSAPITAPGPPLTSAPLAVLVDSHTASASEILAGALQDNCRAVLVGQNTYGKGLIQSVYELGDGSGMVLTVGKYVTPSGTDIDLNGLKADFWITPSQKAAEDAIQACRIERKSKSFSS